MGRYVHQRERYYRRIVDNTRDRTQYCGTNYIRDLIKEVKSLDPIVENILNVEKPDAIIVDQVFLFTISGQVGHPMGGHL